MFRRPPLHYPERPLHHFLQDAADRCPEKIALHFGDDVFTYRELDSTGNSFANALLELGFGPGHPGRARDHQPTGVDHRPARRQPGRRRGRAPEPELEGRRSSSTRSRSRTPTWSSPTPRWRRSSTPPARPPPASASTTPRQQAGCRSGIWSTAPRERARRRCRMLPSTAMPRTRSARARPDCPRRCATPTARWSRR